MPEKLNVTEFAAKIREKYPEYNGVDDAMLSRKFVEKYPEYADRVDLGGGIAPAPAAAVPAKPGILEAAKMGLAEKDLPPDAGFGANMAHFVGENALPIAGSIAGAATTAPAWLPSAGAAGMAGLGAGAAAGRATQKALARAIVPEYVEPESAIQTALDPVAEGAMYAAGEGALRIGGKAVRAVARGVGKPVISTLTGAGRRAIDAIVNDSKGVMNYLGIKPEEVAAGGQKLQEMIDAGKTAIESGYKRLLAKHHDELLKATREAEEHASDLDTQAVALGQAFQKRIPELQSSASKEYQQALAQIESKYETAPVTGAPFSIDIAKNAKKAVAEISKDYGFGVSDLPPGFAGVAKEFKWYADKAGTLNKASVSEARRFLTQLNLAIRNNSTPTGMTPLGSALQKLKGVVSSSIDESSPEIKEMAKRYAQKKEILDALSGDANANVVSSRIHSYFKTGGNQKDALIHFSEQDPHAAEMLDRILSLQNQSADIRARAAQTKKLSEFIGDLKSTYKIGEGKNRAILMAEKDPVMKSILDASAGQESVYGRLKSILGSDNPAAEVERIMSEGGNKADALKELAATSPAIKDMILDVQRRVYGSRLSPWFRELPQTGFTPGLAQAAIGAVGGGYGGYQAAHGNFGPAAAGAALVAASSPRIAAKAIAGAVRGSAAVRGALARPAIGAPVAGAVGGAFRAAGESMGFFQSPEEVKAAHEAGQISSEEAVKELRANWPESFY